MASKVYFTDFCTGNRESLPQKLARLIMTAGFDQIDFENKYAAIKIHFGEKGNLAFLRPNYAKVVVDLIKDLGGKPFLTDANTMYVGSRKNALDHLETAYENGFSPFSTGCHVIIADGLKGTDDVAVPVEGGEYCKEAYIGRAVMDADIVISLNHFKGHELAGFGGAIKNIGMGCGSRAGKADQHSNGQPVVEEVDCRGCKLCQKLCANDGLIFNEETRKMRVNPDKCLGCGRCLGACNFDAIHFVSDNANAVLNCRMAEYAKASGDMTYAQKALDLFKDIRKFVATPGYMEPKYLPSLQAKGHSLVMILINTASRIRNVISDPVLDQQIDESIASLKDFMKEELRNERPPANVMEFARKNFIPNSK